MPGMHTVYGHFSEAMRSELKDALQKRWDNALRDRAQFRPRTRSSRCWMGS